MVGVGILWRQGYTRQLIGEDGMPYDSYPEYRYDFLKDTGIVVDVKIRDRNVKCKVWECTKYNNVPLYLLDTYTLGSTDPFITGQLYGWFDEERIAQEMVLGIGGVKALNELGIKPDIYHFNDSHPVIAGIELIKQKMEKQDLSFKEALEDTRKQIVFTTHTPVEAGNEVHEHRLLKYMGAYNGLTYEEMKYIGGDPFSMTVAGLRLSKIANGVSKLHGETARNMWKGTSGAPEIIAITNGVHNGTWQDKSIVDSFTSNSKLWNSHMELKREMISYIESKNNVTLDDGILTIGFSRRAAPYKRSNLIFRNKEIIENLLKDKKLQIVFSSKAHPNDMEGKKIISNLYNMSKVYPNSVVFIEDYDMKIGKMLTRGCDVWLNNPIRPMEASGTSGMKAAMNGVLNLSVLDGWWPEGCEHGVNGWQIGGGYVGENQDKVDAESLYQVLVEEVIPTYYDNREKWIDMMKESIKMSQEKFSAKRMVNEYYDRLYMSEV
jgi:starch phosphorylase